MIARGKDDDGPRPEELAAYVDGELGPAARARVEAWLADHPESAAEVEALRGLARVWQSAAPPEPSEERWANVLARIEAALPGAAVVRRPRRYRLAWALVGLAAAASVLLAVVLTRPGPVVPTPDPAPEALPVVDADDVDIISINAADRRALVVGELPAPAEIALLGPGEATVDHVKSDVHGMDPYFQGGGSNTPMVYMMPRETEPE